MASETDFKLVKGIPTQMYKCNWQDYWIEEDICDYRQKRKYFKQCVTCVLRRGGLNDPRKEQF